MKRGKQVPWTPVMLEMLRAWYPIYPTVVVAGALDLSARNIVTKAAELGLTKSAEVLACEQAARHQPDRAPKKAKRKVKKRVAAVHWTPVMLQLLNEWYPLHSTAVVAGALDLSVDQVYRKASELGLKKGAEYLASEESGRIQRGKQHPSMVAFQFKKGLVPWNKGSHFVAGGRSQETRFKAGRPASEASNYLPIGTYRVSRDGYLERKVTDDPAIVPVRRWVSVHRIVWMDAHGEIPAGHAVVFKPGRRTTVADEITIDVIELITRQELMRRNSFHTNYPPEVVKLIQLKGAIKRQVNRRIRESQESST